MPLDIVVKVGFFGSEIKEWCEDRASALSSLIEELKEDDKEFQEEEPIFEGWEFLRNKPSLVPLVLAAADYVKKNADYLAPTFGADEHAVTIITHWDRRTYRLFIGPPPSRPARKPLTAKRPRSRKR